MHDDKSFKTYCSFVFPLRTNRNRVLKKTKFFMKPKLRILHVFSNCQNFDSLVVNTCIPKALIFAFSFSIKDNSNWMFKVTKPLKSMLHLSEIDSSFRIC